MARSVADGLLFAAAFDDTDVALTKVVRAGVPAPRFARRRITLGH